MDEQTSTKLHEKKKLPIWLPIAVAAALIIAIIVGVVVYTNSPEQRAAKQISLGEKYLTDLDYEAAVAAFTDALTIDPSNGIAKERLVGAYRSWAGALRSAGQEDRAREILAEGYAATGAAELLEETPSETVFVLEDNSKPQTGDVGSEDKAMGELTLSPLDPMGESNGECLIRFDMDGWSDTASYVDHEGNRWLVFDKSGKGSVNPYTLINLTNGVRIDGFCEETAIGHLVGEEDGVFFCRDGIWRFVWKEAETGQYMDTTSIYWSEEEHVGVYDYCLEHFDHAGNLRETTTLLNAVPNCPPNRMDSTSMTQEEITAARADFDDWWNTLHSTRALFIEGLRDKLLPVDDTAEDGQHYQKTDLTAEITNAGLIVYDENDKEQIRFEGVLDRNMEGDKELQFGKRTFRSAFTFDNGKIAVVTLVERGGSYAERIFRTEVYQIK